VLNHTSVFHTPGIEVFESSNLRIARETTPSDAESVKDSDEEEDIPVRRLLDWTVYDRKTRILIPFSDIAAMLSSGQSSVDVVASGLVRAHIEGGDESDDDVVSMTGSENCIPDDHRVQLAPLLELNIHHYEQELDL
jgi:hypothetical protein